MGIYQIAVDGPSGSGKSTLAKGVAAKLGIMYLDTGAMYRTCGLCALKKGIDPKDEAQVNAMLDDLKVEVKFEDGSQHMILNGEDVTGQIRTPEVSMAASSVSAHPALRTKMVEMQREIAKSQTFILDGRDIASNVLPNAKYKFYVTAPAEVRAERRLAELKERGDESQNYDEVLRDIIQRDEQDMNRAVSPLVQVPEAVVIDTSAIDIDQTRDLLISYIEEVK
ncbi:cytidylate kinase [Ruminococcaceae bacterium YRB3002]|nr:cytidylate kinase [Ruminococcaceae bacterium YRB3002]